jgi:hypothetical protein
MFPVLGAAGASFEIRPGVVAEFATVRQGRAILGTRDSYIQAMSPFDRAVRLQTNGVVTEAQFLRYVKQQVLPWSAADIAAVINVLGQFAARTRDWNLVFPRKFYLVKTTGQEEGNAAYLRGSSVIIPQQALGTGAPPMLVAMPAGAGHAGRRVTAAEYMLSTVLFHELFHLYVYENPQLRPALYGILGFHPCNEVPLPAWLLERRITNPNPEPHDFFIMVKWDGKEGPCMPVIYSKSTNYTGGKLFDYLVSRLMVLESSADGYRPGLLPNGQPRLLSEKEVTGYFEQIGRNTRYNIHAEETLADNFMLLVQGAGSVPTPEILTQLLEVIQSGRPAAQGRPGAKTPATPENAVFHTKSASATNALKPWIPKH